MSEQNHHNREDYIRRKHYDDRGGPRPYVPDLHDKCNLNRPNSNKKTYDDGELLLNDKSWASNISHIDIAVKDRVQNRGVTQKGEA